MDPGMVGIDPHGDSRRRARQLPRTRSRIARKGNARDPFMAVTVSGIALILRQGVRGVNSLGWSSCPERRTWNSYYGSSDVQPLT